MGGVRPPGPRRDDQGAGRPGDRRSLLRHCLGGRRRLARVDAGAAMEERTVARCDCRLAVVPLDARPLSPGLFPRLPHRPPPVLLHPPPHSPLPPRPPPILPPP